MNKESKKFPHYPVLIFASILNRLHCPFLISSSLSLFVDLQIHTLYHNTPNCVLPAALIISNYYVSVCVYISVIWSEYTGSLQ